MEFITQVSSLSGGDDLTVASDPVKAGVGNAGHKGSGKAGIRKPPMIGEGTPHEKSQRLGQGNPHTISQKKTAASDQVQALVAGAGGIDFGECPNNAESAASARSKADEAFKRLGRDVESLVEFILEKKNLHTELKTMARSTARALKEYSKLRQADGLTQGTRSSRGGVKDGECQTSPLFHRGTAPQAPLNRERPSPPAANERKKVKEAKGRKQPIPVLSVNNQESRTTHSKDLEWTEVVKKKGDNKKKKKRSSEDVSKTDTSKAK